METITQVQVIERPGEKPEINMGASDRATPAVAFDRVLRAISVARANVKPEIPQELDLSSPFETMQGTRVHVGIDYKGRHILSIRHPGFGWMHVPVAYEDRQMLLQLLGNPG